MQVIILRNGFLKKIPKNFQKPLDKLEKRTIFNREESKLNLK